MRILLLTDRFAAGGAETHIADLASALSSLGHAVEVAAEDGGNVGLLRTRGIPFHRLPLAKRSPFSLMAARRGLLRLLQKEKYDLIHAHARLPAALAAPLCRACGTPLTVTAHWVFRADGWRRRMSRWGDHTLAVSEDICRYLSKNYGIPRERITKTKNGIDLSRFLPVEKGTKELTVLHVSRLDRGRARCAELLLSLSEEGALPRAADSLIIVGGGELEDALRRRAEAINHRLRRPFVNMTGAVEDVLPYYRRADVFVGVSRAALEAMACGLPVVLLGDEGSLPCRNDADLALAEESNFCCRGGAPATEEGLRAALFPLLSDAAGRREFGEVCRRYVCKHHTRESMAEDALIAYALAARAARERRSKKREATTKKPSLLLCGYYGFSNLGDDAVLANLLSLLSPHFAVTVLSAHPHDTARQFGVRSISRTNLIAVRNAARRADLFLLGGGNLLQNETSNRSLYYYTHLLRLAKRMGCRTCLLGGIGRLNAWGEAAVRRALPCLDGALLRTPRDIERLDGLTDGKAVPHALLPDGGLWVYEGEDGGIKKDPLPKEGGCILISLREGDKEEALFFDLCRALSEKRGDLSLIGLSMQGERDRAAFRRFADLPHFSLRTPSSYREAAACVAAADVLLSTRLHPVVFAAAAGVPAFVPEDSGKLADFADFVARQAALLPRPLPAPPYPTVTCFSPTSPPSADDIEKCLQAPPAKEWTAALASALHCAGGEKLVTFLLEKIL